MQCFLVGQPAVVPAISLSAEHRDSMHMSSICHSVDRDLRIAVECENNLGVFITLSLVCISFTCVGMMQRKEYALQLHHFPEVKIFADPLIAAAESYNYHSFQHEGGVSRKTKLPDHGF